MYAKRQVVRAAPSRLTRPLQIISCCSALFAIGSALHGFVIIDASLIEAMIPTAEAADPAAEAPGFTTGFRFVGTIYVVGNALGVLAWRYRSRLLWWWVVVVNVTQGLGYLMVPP